MSNLTPVPKIILTADGSPTLWNAALDETYHSMHGAISESLHVFIRHGLLHAAIQKTSLSIFEVGLGSGLNALLSWETGEKHSLVIHYWGVEISPLPNSLTRQLEFNTGQAGSGEKLQRLHDAAWETDVALGRDFTLKKAEADLLRCSLLPESIDVIFFDAFAPSVQPEMWTKEVFDKMFYSLRKNGVLVTYCAKGQVRRDMQAAGFVVERLPGPAGKREMLRATKPI